MIYNRLELKYVDLEIVMSLIGILQYFSQYYVFATNVKVLTRLCHANEETTQVTIEQMEPFVQKQM